MFLKEVSGFTTKSLFHRYSCIDFHQTKNVIYKIISLQLTNDGGNVKVDL